MAFHIFGCLCHKQIIQFSSVAQSCLTLGDPMDCSMPGFPVYHQLLELYSDSCLQSFSASGSFQMSQFFASGGQNIGVSALASVLPVNIIGTNKLLGASNS